MTDMRNRTMDRRRMLKTAGGLAVFGGMFTLVGCGDDDDESASPTVATGGTTAPTTAATTAATAAGTTATATLYTRLGGNQAITAVIGEFLKNVAADTRINSFFANANIPRLQMMLINQVGEAAGGPEKYTGADMKSAHAGMMITMADFNALVEDLVKALDTFKVPEKEKNELLSVLGPMNKDIVTA